MRIAIVIVVAVAMGALFGALAARSRMAPLLEMASADRDTARREHERISSELVFAAERLQWLSVENEALRDQVSALQQGAGLPTRPPAAADNPASSAAVTAPGTAPRTDTGQLDTSGEGGADSGDTRPEVTPEQVSEATYEMKRQHINDFLLQEAEQAADPNERERLAALHERQRLVRDAYRQLQDAKTDEEKERLLTAVVQARTDMKHLVEDQRNDLIRRSLEQAGVSDTMQQRQIIESVTTLQQNPYWTEPMMIWGAAAQGQ
jgi:hypothetical protein